MACAFALKGMIFEKPDMNSAVPTVLLILVLIAALNPSAESTPWFERTWINTYDKLKKNRSNEQLPFSHHSPVGSPCPELVQETQLTKASDANGRDMEIRQTNSHVQYFTTVRCADEQSSCRGIDNNRYYSKCHTVSRLQHALARPAGSQESYRITRIYVPVHCSCMLYSVNATISS